MANSTEIMPANCSAILQASRPLIFQTPTSPVAYVVLVVLHICFVVVPSFFLSSITIPLVSELPPHPSKIIFYWICSLSLMGPLSYTILMDGSLLFNTPIFISCESKWAGLWYWLSHSAFETSLLWTFGFYAILLYLGMRRPNRRIKDRVVNIAMICIVLLATVLSCLWVSLTESYSAEKCKVRGSFCLTIFAPPQGVVMTLEYCRILIAALPVLVAVPISVGLYWYKVRTMVIHFDRALSRCLVNISVWLMIGSFLWTLPTMLIHLSTYHGEERSFVHFLTTYTLQLNYVLYPILILTLHKDLRGKVAGLLRDAVLRRLGCCLATSGVQHMELQEIQNPTAQIGPHVSEQGPQTEEQDPQTSDTDPQTGDMDPQTGDTDPQTGDTDPQTGNPSPRTGDMDPQTDDTDPPTDDTNPHPGNMDSPIGDVNPQPPCVLTTLQMPHRVIQRGVSSPFPFPTCFEDEVLSFGDSAPPTKMPTPPHPDMSLQKVNQLPEDVQLQEMPRPQIPALRVPPKKPPRPFPIPPKKPPRPFLARATTAIINCTPRRVIDTLKVPGQSSFSMPPPTLRKTISPPYKTISRKDEGGATALEQGSGNITKETPTKDLPQTKDTPDTQESQGTSSVSQLPRQPLPKQETIPDIQISEEGQDSSGSNTDAGLQETDNSKDETASLEFPSVEEFQVVPSPIHRRFTVPRMPPPVSVATGCPEAPYWRDRRASVPVAKPTGKE